MNTAAPIAALRRVGTRCMALGVASIAAGTLMAANGAYWGIGVALTGATSLVGGASLRRFAKWHRDTNSPLSVRAELALTVIGVVCVVIGSASVAIGFVPGVADGYVPGLALAATGLGPLSGAIGIGKGLAKLEASRKAPADQPTVDG